MPGRCRAAAAITRQEAWSGMQSAPQGPHTLCWSTPGTLHARTRLPQNPGRRTLGCAALQWPPPAHLPFWSRCKPASCSCRELILSIKRCAKNNGGGTVAVGGCTATLRWHCSRCRCWTAVRATRCMYARHALCLRKYAFTNKKGCAMAGPGTQRHEPKCPMRPYLST